MSERPAADVLAMNDERADGHRTAYGKAIHPTDIADDDRGLPAGKAIGAVERNTTASRRTDAHALDRLARGSGHAPDDPSARNAEDRGSAFLGAAVEDAPGADRSGLR